MDDELLRYDRMVETALRGVIREALAQAAEHGLPGDHHFYLTFRTDYPGVRLPDHLRAQFPDEMTIVLQHQFWDLTIREESFEVGLSFNRVPEHVAIPFAAVTAFADPEVKFGLKFEFAEEDAAPDEGEFASERTAANTQQGADAPVPPTPADDDAEGGSVVSLDAFRRKPSSGERR